MRLRGLYGMVDLAPRATVDEARALAGALARGGACALQVRMKGADARDVLAVARALVPLAREARVPLVVNDRLDVALATGADGVHLGQDDLPLADARRLAPAGFLVGISTHDLDQVRAAAKAGADYLGFGPVFPTATKANPDPVVGVAGLAAACAAVAIPIVAIGGIPVERAGEIARAGAAAAAIVSAVNRASDVVAAACAVAAAWA